MLKINETYKKLALTLPKSIINGESRVIVGFSGGPDSRFLLDFLRSVINNPKENLIVAHINYGLRSEESYSDETLVSKICKDEKLLLENLSKGLGNSLSPLTVKPSPSIAIGMYCCFCQTNCCILPKFVKGSAVLSMSTLFIVPSR